jgi:hypothetical protein
MKSLHILKTIVLVPAPPLDGERNSRGVKKYRKVEKSIVVLILFHTLYCCARHLVAALELLCWPRAHDSRGNVNRSKMSLLLFYAPWLPW